VNNRGGPSSMLRARRKMAGIRRAARMRRESGATGILS
jgi:hypothetical protein